MRHLPDGYETPWEFVTEQMELNRKKKEHEYIEKKTERFKKLVEQALEADRLMDGRRNKL